MFYSTRIEKIIQFWKSCLTPHYTKKRTQFLIPFHGKQTMILINLNKLPRPFLPVTRNL